MSIHLPEPTYNYFDAYCGYDFKYFSINGRKFAIFVDLITSKEQININLKDYHVIFLSSVVAENDIFIEAISVIAMRKLASIGSTSTIQINASNCILLNSETQATVISINGSLNSRKINEKTLQWVRNQYLEGIKPKDQNDMRSENEQLKERGEVLEGALTETVDLIRDPHGKIKDSHIDIIQLYEFFNIPIFLG